MHWKQVWELVPFAGIRSQYGELLPFGISRKELRQLLGQPDGTFTRGDHKFPESDNYGSQLDGDFQVRYRQVPDLIYPATIRKQEHVSDGDEVARFCFVGRGRAVFQGIRLMLQPTTEVLAAFATLGYVPLTKPLDDFRSSREYGISHFYFPDLGLELFASKDRIRAVTLIERELLERAPEIVAQYCEPFTSEKAAISATPLPRLKLRSAANDTEARKQVSSGPPVLAIRIDTMPAVEAKLPVGRSKIGGQPDLPSSIDWPDEAAFVAQFNCAEVATLGAGSDLPATGMIYFFVRFFGERGFAFYSDVQVDQLERVAPPDFVEEIFDPCGVTFNIIDERAFGVGENDGPTFEDMQGLKLLGYPAPVQQMYRHFDYENEVLLLQLMNNADMNFDIGDGAGQSSVRRR